MSQITQLTLSTGELITFRAATKQEAVSAHAFMVRQLAATEHAIMPDEVTAHARAIESWCAFYCDQPSNLLLLAWSATQIVGVLDFHRLSLVRQNHLGQLGISIDPAYRGLGIGRALLLNLFDWLEAYPEIRKVSVQILASNTPSIHLFQKCGFRFEARISQAVQSGRGFEDILILSRWIQPPTKKP